MMKNWATVHLSCEIVTLLLRFKCQQTFWLSLLINLLSSIEVYCQPPTEVEQGYVVAVQKTEYEVGFDIHYLCKRNFLLDGPQMITCLSNGSWSAPPPHCRGEERSNLISGLFNKAEVKCRETPLHKVLETQINVHLHTAINKHSIMCLMFIWYFHTLLVILTARCLIPAERSRVMIGGVKRWPFDVTDAMVPHGENVTFFCKHPRKQCSFTATQTCFNGKLQTPACYLGKPAPAAVPGSLSCVTNICNAMKCF